MFADVRKTQNYSAMAFPGGGSSSTTQRCVSNGVGQTSIAANSPAVHVIRQSAVPPTAFAVSSRLDTELSTKIKSPGRPRRAVIHRRCCCCCL